MTEECKKGFYRHYKGPYYEVLEVAYHTETMEQFVIYKAAEEKAGESPKMWARPLSMFLGKIELKGEMVPRFSYAPEKGQ